MPVENLPTITGGACLLPSSPIKLPSICLPGELGARRLVGCMEGSSRNCARSRLVEELSIRVHGSSRRGL